MDDEFYFEDNYLRYSSSSHSQATPTTKEITGIIDEEFELKAQDWKGCEECRSVFSAAGQAQSHVLEEQEPSPPLFPANQLENYVKQLLTTSLQLVEMFAQKRRNHQKYKDDPQSLLTGREPFPPAQLSFPAAKKLIDQTKASFRRTVFGLPDFQDVSTASLRHTCMGVLVDSYRLYLKFNSDLDTLTQELFGEVCASDPVAMLDFLACIELHPVLVEVCQYCVVSKASSTAKGMLRKIYLDLLALRHNTTPTLAQELVPGFTYDHIESLDEVVQLVEQGSSSSDDQEIERFRQSLLRAKALTGPKVRIELSDQFLARVEAKLKSAKTTRA